MNALARAFSASLAGLPKASLNILDSFSSSVDPGAFLAMSLAELITKASFIMVRDCAGTFVVSRLPFVVAGTGASKTLRKGSRELRLICL